MSTRSLSSTNSSDAVLPQDEVKKKEEPQTWGEIFRAWPKATFCIVTNEFCEKFSYYGMRAVLTLYLLNVLKFNDSHSTVFFNGFTVVSCLTPLLGSFVADGLIGKFRTIFGVSLLFITGQIMLAFSSLNDSAWPLHPWLDLGGLCIIALASGGIKPCVSSFGGDQFEAHQTRMISLFFSMFYFSINIGSMVSSFVAPLFRSMPCLGHDSCYPLAFGMSAFLMIIATIIFMLGSFSYKKNPPKGNVFGEAGAVIMGAIRNRGGPSKNRWLDRYYDTHRCEDDMKCMKLKLQTNDPTACQKAEVIQDIRSLVSVAIMFLPIPMYWALYDQQGSVWLIQGIQMDCNIWGDTLLLPDQMQAINSTLILVFIPIFQIIIYPTVSKFVTITPLRKMVVGGILASMAFVSAGLVQLHINKTLPESPPAHHGFVSVMNNLRDGCSFSGIGDYSFGPLDYNTALMNNKLTNTHDMLKVPEGHNITFQFKHTCTGNNYVTTYVAPEIKDKKFYNLIVTELGAVMLQVNPNKPTKGTGDFSLSITMALSDVNYVSHLALCRVDSTAQYPCDPRKPNDFYYYEVNYNEGKDTDLDSIVPYTTNQGLDPSRSVSGYTFKAIRPGNWSFWYMHNLAKGIGMKSLEPEQLNITSTGQYISIKNQGGVYAAVFTGTYNSPIYHVNQIVPPNTVSILWQVPQFVIITLAEILFSITGYEFSYSQAAPSMKAFVQALWTLTTAIGDSIIVLIALLNLFDDLAVQFFVYAGAMLVVMVIFALLAIFYYDYKTYHTHRDIMKKVDDEETQLMTDNPAVPHTTKATESLDLKP